tara:strand:+ start:360 stop:1298 length:939 start_codon:yes stop_codon:yes gene_type:complete
MELYNAECIEHMKTMDERSVDLFVLDLPYANKVFGKCTAMGWDSPIDLTEMWIQIKRIMKPSAVIVHFCNVKFGFALIQSNPKWFRYDLIWKKSSKVGFLSANKQPLRQHENIYVFKKEQGVYNPQKTEGKPYIDKRDRTKKNIYGGITEKYIKENKGDRHPTSIVETEPDHENMYIFKDEQGTYNPQKTEGKPYTKNRKGHSIEKYCYGGIDRGDDIKINKGDRHPTSIIENTILEHNNPHKPIHRTQKPVSLLEWLIKSYSNEGDVVMDFCMGSGTAGIACLNTKRYFIGVEKDEEIFNLATKRIEEHEL